MVDSPESFEQIDSSGQTLHKNGPFSTVPTLIPVAPISGQFISEILINTQKITNSTDRLLVSFDEGTTFMELKRNTIVGWFVRGKVPQLHVKGSGAAIPSEIVVNMEEL